jgi:hypothetical protein
VARRVDIPAAVDRRADRLRAERVRLEVTEVRAVTGEIEAMRVEMRAALEGLVDPAAPYTLEAHARAVPLLRLYGSRLAALATTRATAAAKSAAKLGVAHFSRIWVWLGAAALGRKVPAPPLDPARVVPRAFELVEARTVDVCTFAGEDSAQRAVVESYRVARAYKPEAGAVAALLVADAWRDRAVPNVDRLVVTEITAGYAEGGEVSRVTVAQKMPRMKKVWDATLDRRVCRRCAPLHHVVVPFNEPFPGGFTDAPAHARCRCCVVPWFDDWSDALTEADTSPGPRTGVQASAEQRLEAWTDEPIEGWRP